MEKVFEKDLIPGRRYKYLQNVKRDGIKYAKSFKFNNHIPGSKFSEYETENGIRTYILYVEFDIWIECFKFGR